MLIRTVLFCTTALVFQSAARCDILNLSNGGQVEGTLEQVSFLADGKKTSLSRSEVKALSVSAATLDSLDLAGGSKLQGELLSLRIRTIGGLLTFVRRDVTALALAEDPLAELRKELAARKAQIAPNDGKALLELAEWCSEKGLKSEAAELARAALETDPSADWAKTAHKLLGHVLYDYEWMTQDEMMKRKQAAEWPGGAGPAGPPGSTEAAAASTEKGLGPEEIEAIKAAMARNEELRKSYREKSDVKRGEEADALRKKYGRPWNENAALVKSLSNQIRQVENALAEQAMRYDPNPSRKIDEAAYRKRAHEFSQQLAAALSQRDRLASVITAAQAKVAGRASDRAERIYTVYMKHIRLLRLGKTLTEAQMADAYDAAFKQGL